MIITHKIYQSVLGPVIVAWNGREICFVHFGDSERQLLALLHSTFACVCTSPSPKRQPNWNYFGKLIERMIKGSTSSARPHAPLHQHGTPFQIKVWEYLKSIPSGEARSYGDVAQAIGHPRAIRAVASACARNNLALFIPCHRVIRSDGSLGGYKWGMQRKRALLESERGSRGAPYQGISVTGDIGETVPSGGK